MVCIGIGHLLLHLHRIGIHLRGNARTARGGGQAQAMGGLSLSEVDEQQLCAGLSGGRIKVELGQHVVDAVGTERDAHAAESRHTEDARQVIVAATARDGTDLHVECLHLKDAPRVIVQAAGQRQVKFNGVPQVALRERFEHKGHFVHALQAHFAAGEHGAHGGELLLVRTGQGDDGLQFLYGLIGKPYGAEFIVHLFETDLVKFVNGHGDVHDFVRRPDGFGNAGKDFAVIDFDAHVDAESREHLVHDLHQLHLVEQGIGAHHVGIALVKLAVTSLLRAVGAPYGLDLIAFERQLQLVAVLHHEAGEGHGEVVAQSLFTEAGGQLCGILFAVFIGRHLASEVARIENFEEQFVALFAIFPHERGEVLHGRGFDLAETVECIDASDGFKNIVAPCHFHGAEIACTLGYAGFLSHISMIYVLLVAGR